MKRIRLCVLLFLGSWSLGLQAAPLTQAAVASAHPLATRAGLAVMAQGGNAFDAAVAVSAALAVVEPYSSGLGGGGFWLLHRASDGHEVMVDGRERAPLAAQHDMYLDAQGEPIPQRSIDGPLAAGIPGEPAALVHIAKHYGRLPLSQSLATAIRLARDGFAVGEHYRRMASWRQQALRASPDAAAIFLQDGEVPALGYTLRQPDLARTLQALADRGHAGFYAGPVARALIEGVRAGGGIWSEQDLAAYRIVERPPVSGVYRGLRITSAAPPSSGGVALLTMLNILSAYDLETLAEADRTHLIVEAMRRAYRDRAEYLGDPDFVSMPLTRLIHPYYADGLRATLRPDKATPSASLPGFTHQEGGHDTTHFSVLDSAGNYVAATLSINYPFGAAYVPAATGVLLNDEMDDFSAKPGTPNVYGLVGAEANAIAPGKRMLSSMSPTFVAGEEGVAILGTPGGSRIISMVLLGILEAAAGRKPEAWVTRPRFHHQYLPDTLFFEPGALDEGLQQQLAARGHQLKALDGPYGNMQAIWWDKKNQRVWAASDPRVEGAAEVR